MAAAGLGAGIRADVRYALRQLRTAPGFAVTAVLTLALTVGLAAVVFSVFDAVLVRPLPFGHVSRLMDVQTWAPEGYTQPASWPEYKFWQANGAKVLDIAGYQETTVNMQAGASPVPVHALGVSTNFFTVMGVDPQLGRFFRADEGEHGENHVAVLSYAMWRTHFGGRPGVVGSKIDLDGMPMVVIGVAPAGFRLPLDRTDQVYEPVAAVPGFAAMLDSAGTHWLSTVARLQPGVSREQAQAAMAGVLQAYARVHADEPTLTQRKMKLEPLAKSLLGQTSGFVESLAMAVLAVMLLGCVNIAGLLLARGLRRERELALRAALGASRITLGRQLAAELLVLAVCGAVAGFGLAAGLLAATRDLLVSSLDRGSDIHLNMLAFAAALFAAVATLLLAGLIALRQVLRVSPAAALRSGSTGAGTSRGRNRVRAVMLAAQVSMAVLLMTSSAMLLTSLHAARSVALGFAPDHLLYEEVVLPAGAGASQHPYTTFYGPLIEKLEAVPGIRYAALDGRGPLSGIGNNSEMTIEGEPPQPPGADTLADSRFVSPSYFRTLGIRLLRGRLLTNALDGKPGHIDVVVNQTFVQRFFRPGEDPIGRRIMAWVPEGMQIVGVVSDVRQDLFAPEMPEFDLLPTAGPADWEEQSVRDAEIVLRTTIPPAQLREPLRKAMASVDPNVPFRPAMTMDDVMREVLTLQLLENWLFGAFGALALVLALVGLYGLVAQEVEQGRRAIGIRMALGAARGRVLRGVLRRVAVTAGCGVAVGAALSYAARQVLASLLPVAVPHSVLVAGAVAMAMELLAVWAAWAPARRAASVDPVEVLRAE